MMWNSKGLWKTLFIWKQLITSKIINSFQVCITLSPPLCLTVVNGKHAGVDPLRQRDSVSETQPGSAEGLPAGFSVGSAGDSHWPAGDRVSALFLWWDHGRRDGTHVGPGAENYGGWEAMQYGGARGGGWGAGAWKWGCDPKYEPGPVSQTEPAQHGQPAARLLKQGVGPKDSRYLLGNCCWEVQHVRSFVCTSVWTAFHSVLLIIDAFKCNGKCV